MRDESRAVAESSAWFDPRCAHIKNPANRAFLCFAFSTFVDVLLARRCLAGRRRLFFVLPPLAFASQELAERLLHAEGFPFHAALEPRFPVGLLLQLPFGLLAILVAHWLLRVVTRLVLALARCRGARLQSRRPSSAASVRLAPDSGARARLPTARPAGALRE
jgi:hypothetical protein